MLVPTLHLNGSSADALFEQARAVAEVLRLALDAMAYATPHGRDYYPQGPDALRQATEEHRLRCNKVAEVLKEYEELAKKIAKARDARLEGKRP